MARAAEILIAGGGIGGLSAVLARGPARARAREGGGIRRDRLRHSDGTEHPIEDAVVLGAKVGAEGTDFNRAFLAYQEERFYRTARVQITARLFGDIMHADGRARDLRNYLCARRDPDFPHEVDWLYRGIEVKP